MRVKSDALIIVGVALAVFGMAWWAKNQVAAGAGKALQTASDLANAINPMNNDNIINQGFTAAYQSITGSDGNLGGDYYDWTHPQMKYIGDPLTSNSVTAVNVPGTPGFDNTKVATNAGGYVMNGGDAAIAQISTFKWPWE